MKKLIFIYLFVSFLLLSNAYAYLDAGTTSYLLQILIGFLVGGVVLIKMFWIKIKAILIKLFSKKK